MYLTRRWFAVSALLACAVSAVCVTSPCAAQSQPARALAETTASVSATVSAPPTLTINAVGDLCFASNGPSSLIASKGPKAPFARTASWLRNADITLGNLECALSRRGSAVPGKAFTFRANPRDVEGLQYAGFDVVSQGNNHARDFGPTALMDTVGYLNKAHIAHAGAGKNRAAAFAPAIFRSKDATIAYLSFCEIGPANFAAGSSSPGTAYTTSVQTVKAAVAAARRKATYVIVSFHWGIEGTFSPVSYQVTLGHAAINSGADLVLSEHPHVLQGVEFYRHKLIAYSLGNFVFSPGSVPAHDSMALRVTMGPHGIASVIARPVFIGSSGEPGFAAGSNARRILSIIAKTSRGRGSKVTVRGTAATIKP